MSTPSNPPILERARNGKRNKRRSELVASGAIHGKATKDAKGYLRAVDLRYPGKSARQVHRIIMENEIGRPLLTSEHVHHINHDPADNRIENLQIVERRRHIEMHATPLVTVTCPNCGSERQKRQIKVSRYRYGSCWNCRHVFVSKSLRRLRSHLRCVWFVHSESRLSEFFETRKEAYENSPQVKTQKDRTLLIVNLETGEVSVTNKRKGPPVQAVPLIRLAAQQLYERLKIQ